MFRWQSNRQTRAWGLVGKIDVAKYRKKGQKDRQTERQREKMATHTDVMTKAQNELQIYKHVSESIYTSLVIQI